MKTCQWCYFACGCPSDQTIADQERARIVADLKAYVEGSLQHNPEPHELDAQYVKPQDVARIARYIEERRK